MVTQPQGVVMCGMCGDVWNESQARGSSQGGTGMAFLSLTWA